MSDLIVGTYFDGKFSKAHKASLKLIEEIIQLEVTDHQKKEFLRSDIQIDSPLPGLPRKIHFATGELFQTTDFKTFDQKFLNHRSPLKIYNIEKHWKFSVPILLALIFTLYMSYFIGIHWVAQHGSHIIPDSISKSVGDKTIKYLTRAGLFKKSLLPSKKIKIIQDLLLKTTDHFKLNDLKVNFVHSPKIGPNAFAFPNKNIIFTDQLILLNLTEEELIAIFLHEAGHIFYKHSLQTLIQNEVSALIFFSTFGISDLNALSMLLLSGSYSRENEKEADLFAKKHLLRIDLNPKALITALYKMEKLRKTKLDKKYKWLSSHPLTIEREKYILNDQ